jgi:hypothetical protein
MAKRLAEALASNLNREERPTLGRFSRIGNLFEP